MPEGKTSYDAIYDLLFETSTCQDIWEAAVKDLDEVKIEKVEWSLVQRTDSASATPNFHLTGETVWQAVYMSSATLEARSFIRRDAAKKILDIHFGPEKDVKTRNCKVGIVKNGGSVHRKDSYGYRSEHYQNSFHEFLTDKFQEEAHEKMKAATERLKKEVQAMQQTDEFRKSQHEALVGFCKDAITKALLPWHTMDENVLQDAWDQFICTAIMRT